MNDSLVDVCMTLGKQLKIQFTIPQQIVELAQIEEKLERICLASQVRKREVLLQGNWWETDHGPLLGFVENQPMIIQYPVHPEKARRIASIAYMFYVPFDPGITTGKQILHLILKDHMKHWKLLLPIGLFGALYGLFPPIATKLLFQYAVPENDPSLIVYLTLGLLFSALGFSFFCLLRGLFSLKLKGVGTNFIQGAFWDRLLKLPIRFFRRYAVGNLFSRVFAIEEIRKLLTANATSSILSGLFSLLYLSIMFCFAPFLSLLVCLVAAVGLSITALCCRFKLHAVRKLLALEGTIRGTFLQMIVGIFKLRAAGAEKRAFSHWKSLFIEAQGHRREAQHLQNIGTSFNALLPLVSILIIYIAMLEWIEPKAISLPDFLAFNIAFGSFSLAIYPLGDTLLQIVNILPLWERAKVILEEPIEERKSMIDPGPLSGEIKLEKVIFGYNPKIPPILNEITLSIKPGEFIGIAGKTGCGKTTLMRLLLGFEKPTSGGIFYDSKDLWSLDLIALRQQIGSAFYDFSIMPEMLYLALVAGGTYSVEQIQEALQFSGLDKDIETFPMKMATMTQTFSGGQKQRLTLSRAVLGRPPIFLFNEATTELDSESREKVSKNIENLKATRILTTHRLGDFRKADRIYVLDGGRIVQTGTYDELAKVPGIFGELLEKQKL